MSANRTPRSPLLLAYQHALEARGLKSDAAQRKVLTELDRLGSELLEAELDSQSLAAKLRRRLGNSRAQTPVRGIYLWGDVGRGKTFLMDLFFDHLDLDRRRRVHFHRFMFEVHRQLRSLRNVAAPLERVAAKIAKDTRLLCFDEFFVADIADAMILGGLFKAMFDLGVTLVVTSNVPPDELYRDGLQRQRFLPAIEHIKRNTRVVEIGRGVDYRLRELTRHRLYLDSAVAASSDELATLFELLSGEVGERDDSIAVAGRRIPYVRHSDNVIWFEFSALCQGHRSQTDYIEIADQYQSVLLGNVPVFDARHEDAARRFIALVDELYDRSVNLIVSAAAPPGELYRGSKLTFEFRRTASRLMEMQSEDYLSRAHFLPPQTLASGGND
ncbi:MAG: cell division protein ZapE [Steroidobacteraceae bacterium]